MSTLVGSVEELTEVGEEFGREFDDDGAEIFSLENPRDLVEEDWARGEASDILDLAGDDYEVTGDGTVVACNIKVELALSQPQMTEYWYLRRLSERRPESAAVLGLEISAGGSQPSQKPTAAVELFSLGCEHGLCNCDGSVGNSEDVMKGDDSHSDSVCGISSRSKGGAPKGSVRYMGPVFIKRRRRHHTFELNMGNSRHRNIYHIITYLD